MAERAISNIARLKLINFLMSKVLDLKGAIRIDVEADTKY